jgi:Cys-tRNA(Pro)/Cys-tRNA(Cys) deacylase
VPRHVRLCAARSANCDGETSVNPRVAGTLNASPHPFIVRRHADFPKPILGFRDFALALGYDEARITKTLLVRTVDGGGSFALLVAPCNRRIDMKAVACMLSAKRVRMATPFELQQVTGYPPGGVSPLGVVGIRILVDQSLLPQPTVLVGAGEPAVEIELAPDSLTDLTRATVALLSID